METTTTDVCIVGGGVAGLIAATSLAERGLKPIVLEAHPGAIGGRLRDEPPACISYQGQTWQFAAEHGVHGIWSPYVNLRAVLARHGIMPDIQASSDETWIDGRGQRVRVAEIGNAMRESPIPPPFHYLSMFVRPHFLRMLSPQDVVSLFLVQGRLISALAIDPLAEGKSLERMTLADFMSGWSPALKNLFAGLARNALATAPERAPAAGFIAFLRFYTLMRRDAWEFGYLPGTGGALICEPLAERARALGAEIRLGCRAERLERTAGGWQVVYQTAHGQAAIAAAHVVLALDAPAAARLLRASPATAPEAQALRFPRGVATTIVRLWFRASPRAGAESGICTGDMQVDNFFWLHLLQPDYRRWHAATGGSAVELHLYDPLPQAEQDDAALITKALFDLTRAFPELRGTFVSSTIQRNPPTHTLFTPGDAGQALAVETPWPGIVACGDWVAHPNPAMYLERAATTGIVAANHILEACRRPAWPLEAHPEPEWLAGFMARRLQRFRQRMVARRLASG
ncbi:MAG TPA: FAD-dependent oxidoreductase [Roseiflexaceae bacterium]|nr:FAD-dependent oxidoreductase [Roseiflexaceae bacterium]